MGGMRARDQSSPWGLQPSTPQRTHACGHRPLSAIIRAHRMGEAESTGVDGNRLHMSKRCLTCATPHVLFDARRVQPSRACPPHTPMTHVLSLIVAGKARIRRARRRPDGHRRSGRLLSIMLLTHPSSRVPYQNGCLSAPSCIVCVGGPPARLEWHDNPSTQSTNLPPADLLPFDPSLARVMLSLPKVCLREVRALHTSGKP